MIKRFQIVQLPLAICAYFLSLLKYLQLNEIRVYNSDLLYIPTLFKDVTEWGGSLLEWRLTPAPYFFPDMALYFPLAITTTNWQLVLVLCAIAQTILFTIGWCLIGQCLFDKKQARAYSSYVLLVAAILLATPNAYYLISPQFLISNHFGVILCLPYLLYLTLELINQNKHFLLIITFFLATALITVSDSISYAHLTLPLIIALLFLWLLNKILQRTFLFIIALLTMGIVTAQLLANWFIYYPPFPAHFQNMSVAQEIGDSLTEVALTATKLWEGNHQIVLIILIVATVVHLGFCLVATQFVVNQRPFNPQFLFITIFSLSSFVLAIVAVVSRGLFFDITGIRYLHPVTVVPIYSLLPISYFIIHRLSISNLVLLPVSIFIILTHTDVFTQFEHLSKYDDYYPPLVACIDKATSERGIYAGVGGYWDAKYISILSKHGVKISQVKVNFDPDIWINNPYWYERFPPKFVLFDPNARFELGMDFIINRFGYPEEIINCETRELWFYDRSDDQPFQSYFQNHPDIVNWYQPVAHDTIPASLWPNELSTIQGSSLISDNQSGYISSGQLSFYPPGRYQINLLYQYMGTSQDAQIGELSVRLTSIDPEAPEPVWYKEPILLHKSVATISLETTEYSHILITVFFEGKGVLRLDRFDLNKTPALSRSSSRGGPYWAVASVISAGSIQALPCRPICSTSATAPLSKSLLSILPPDDAD